MSLTVDIAVDDPSWAAVGDLQTLVEAAAAAALAEAGVAPDRDTELSCLLCDDAAIQDLNARWRGKDRPTNVLSFPTEGPGADVLLGDIALAYGTVVREADAEGRRIEDHVAHLVIHGTLHLLGADHEVEAAADAMEAMETRAMARLGRPDPYAASPSVVRPEPVVSAP